MFAFTRYFRPWRKLQRCFFNLLSGTYYIRFFKRVKRIQHCKQNQSHRPYVISCSWSLQWILQYLRTRVPNITSRMKVLLYPYPVVILQFKITQFYKIPTNCPHNKYLPYLSNGLWLTTFGSYISLNLIILFPRFINSGFSHTMILSKFKFHKKMPFWCQKLTDCNICFIWKI